MAWDTPSQSGFGGCDALRVGAPVRLSGHADPHRATGRHGSSKFQVLILPSGGNYAGILGESGIERVKDWVSAGGTIVALGDAVNFLGNSKVELLELLQENALRDGDDKKAADKAEKGSARVPGTAIASETRFR